MATVREFLAKDPLGTADAELKRLDGIEHFGNFLPENVNNIWPKTLSLFTRSAPLRYWSIQVLETALGVLEQDPTRTIKALSTWKGRIGVGFEYLFRPAPIELFEEGYSAPSGEDLVRLANEFHPEYLRRCEHIYTNLIVLYWAILKRHEADGVFDITRAVGRLKKTGHNMLLSGYDERVRNAIAHGEVVFRGLGIRYGPEVANYELLTYEFFERFDEIWRTANSLAIALIIFLARYHTRIGSPSIEFSLPTGIINLIAAAEVEREGLSIMGLVESNLPNGERQLHISLHTVFRRRIAVLLECSRLALSLLESGGSGYARYLFEIDHGRQRGSMAIILPERLAELLRTDAPFGRIGEIYDKSQLLWYDEGELSSFARSLRLSFVSNAKLAWKKYLSSLQEQGLFVASGRYRVKKVENASAGGIARINVLIVLCFPRDAQNRALMREIIYSAIRQMSRRWIQTNPSGLVRRFNWLSQPKYIWVSLYQFDGPTRWLGGGGWLGGNLLAQAEFIRNRKLSPILIKQPEEIWNGIRLRYSEAAVAAIAQKVNITSELQRSSQ